MRSHFSLSQGAATLCAIAGASTVMNGKCSAQTLVAADYATNSAYASGWATGQNAGHGFGAWSFNQTQNPDNSFATSGQQGMSSSSPLGMAWTLFNLSSSGGLANAGRSINGGLLPGQTFQMVIENPSTSAGIYTYRGFDMLFTANPDNDLPGDNTSALRMQVFDYFDPSQHWKINDAAGNTTTPLFGPTTAAAGVQISLTLTSTNTYSLTMTPLNGATAYSHSGTLGTNLPISYVNFRLYNTTSSGLGDTADNFGIKSMTIAGLTLNIQKDGSNVVLSWPANLTGFTLVSSTNLVTPVWSPVSPAPVVSNGQNVVTNAVAGNQQFYRLQQ